jgi:uncharacterized protein with PQ loop repeat
MINLHWSLQQIFGNALIFTSIFDVLKYVVQANKIRKQKTAKGMSRRFINWAVSNDIVKLIYGIIIGDLYIILSSLLALVCMAYLWVVIYLYYPYRHRGLVNFKRTNVILYLINSLIPNSIRRRL